MAKQMGIRIEDLHYSFGEVRALRGLDMVVPEGSIYGLVGRNGAGKTTTLRLAMGILRASSGSIEVLGMDPVERGAELRSMVGYLPEDRSLYGYMTVDETLSFARSLRRRWDGDLVEEFLDHFRIPRHRPVSDLSAGVKTQLSLTLAAAHRPRLLLLDEPTAHLDPVGVRELFGAILGLAAEEGQTVILSSHALQLVEGVADHVGIMVEGRLVQSGPVDGVKDREKRIRAVFQVDPPRELLDHPAVVGIEGEGRRLQFTVRGDVDEIMEICRRIPHFALEILDMDLEAIFHGYAGEVRGEGQK